MKKDLVCQLHFDRKKWCAVSVIITRRNMEYSLGSLVYCFQEAHLNPDHLPIMPPFIQYSIIYIDKEKCAFVFEILCACVKILRLRLHDLLTRI